MPTFSFSYLPSAETSTDVGSLKGLVYARGNIVGDYTLMSRDTSLSYQAVKDEYGDPKYASWEMFFISLTLATIPPSISKMNTKSLKRVSTTNLLEYIATVSLIQLDTLSPLIVL